ncbi:mechanosensitive ion channel domain-containing protein [Ectothiorhodospira mobilis]|uniref:mechanosensitive ion channel domain-containing protein n=1 Tax=Ectothiorhodospira mobilis TaxID=195064 RepID=UPI002378530E|nr:mechanosensitive ion channel domain-containing protein [Ectothiorhodospira mobilis]
MRPPIPFLSRILPRIAVVLLLLCAALPLQAQEAAPGDSRLADLLEDEAAREALIKELRRAAAEEGTATGEAADVPPTRQVAQWTQSLAEGTVEQFNTAIQATQTAWDQMRAADPMDLTVNTLELAGLIIATLAVLWLLSRLDRLAYQRLDRHALARTGSAGVVRRVTGTTAALLLDLATVALAWAAGHALALFVTGEAGQMTARDSLFLNAFLLVELTRAALRLFLSHRWPGLRLLPLSDAEAAACTRWTSGMTAFLGYGLLFVVPVTALLVAPEPARLLGLLILAVAYYRAVVLVLRNRKRVQGRLMKLGERMDTGFGRIALQGAGRIWHLAALAYLTAILVVALVFPGRALPFMIAATAQTLLAAAAGILLSLLLGRVILKRIRLPEETREGIPLLEERLNAYIPTVLKVLRFTLLAVVAAAILDAWTPFSLTAWAASDAGGRFIGNAVAVALILAGAMLVWLGLTSWIEYRLSPATGNGEPNARVRTLLTIFRNAAAITLVVMTLMVVLAQVGINIGPLIAGAGVLGLAIGFGAQKLVQDVITGVFIQLENAFNVGDVVTAGGITGTVERLTIRSMGMRDLSGTYHLLPFSSVDTVSNYMRDFAFHVGEYGVAYREDTDEVLQRMNEAFEELRKMPEMAPHILGDLEVHGVTALADSAVNVRVRIKTRPGMQWAVGREYNRLVKRHFDAAGIEIPFPHMTLYFGEDKDGQAPPARVYMQGAASAPAAVEPSATPTASTPQLQPNPQFKGDFDEEEPNG